MTVPTRELSEVEKEDEKIKNEAIQEAYELFNKTGCPAIVEYMAHTSDGRECRQQITVTDR